VRSAETAARPRPGDSAQREKRPTQPVATGARRAVAAWSPRAVRACGGGLDGGAVGAGKWQGIADEHRWGPREAPGKKS
jgi:hypothetical protein